MNNDCGSQQCTGHVHNHLHHIHPDNGANAPHVSVKNGKQPNQQNGKGVKFGVGESGEQATALNNNRQGNRCGKQAHPIGQNSGYHKGQAGGFPHFGAKAGSQKMIGRCQLPFKIAGHHNGGNQQAAGKIPEGNLQEGHIPRVGNSGNTNEGQYAGFRRHDAKCRRQPGHFPVGQKIVRGAALPASYPGTCPCRNHHIHRNNHNIQQRKMHLLILSLPKTKMPLPVTSPFPACWSSSLMSSRMFRSFYRYPGNQRFTGFAGNSFHYRIVKFRPKLNDFAVFPRRVNPIGK